MLREGNVALDAVTTMRRELMLDAQREGVLADAASAAGLAMAARQTSRPPSTEIVRRTKKRPWAEW
ncbi:hypothetical protein OMK73_36290 [Cupriavidus sp. D39]|nr:hypothetical protein [Cupriavidus sp. D39]MCY0858511.1 hypothetical protein [Cupriavidus sp. D39]